MSKKIDVKFPGSVQQTTCWHMKTQDLVDYFSKQGHPGQSMMMWVCPVNTIVDGYEFTPCSFVKARIGDEAYRQLECEVITYMFGYYEK